MEIKRSSWIETIDKRTCSVLGFSFLFAYILSFLFEGEVLYSRLEFYSLEHSVFILIAMVSHFVGLIIGGLVTRNHTMAKRIMLWGMGLCLVATFPFYWGTAVLCMTGLVVSGFAGGCAVAAWGYYLKAFTPSNQRIKSCADALIHSNFLMILITLATIYLSSLAGLIMSQICLLICMGLIWLASTDTNWAQPDSSTAPKIVGEGNMSRDIRKPLLLLCLFVFIITIDSGLMYQVIKPSFDHLTGLTSWYWAVPYIVALLIVRNLPSKTRNPLLLYVGMTMIVGSFVGFSLVGRGAIDYLIVDTLMLGAMGIFDLFWWNIIGEMLDHSENPAKVLGSGLAANVAGVFSGGYLGMAVTSIQLPSAELTIIALTIICITLILLPPLNHQLSKVLRDNRYLPSYEDLNESRQTEVAVRIKAKEPLTAREEEVLEQILSGKSTRMISSDLFISESTVKTHTRNIFTKYGVASRAELISNLLRDQNSAG